PSPAPRGDLATSRSPQLPGGAQPAPVGTGVPAGADALVRAPQPGGELVAGAAAEPGPPPPGAHGGHIGTQMWKKISLLAASMPVSWMAPPLTLTHGGLAELLACGLFHAAGRFRLVPGIHPAGRWRQTLLPGGANVALMMSASISSSLSGVRR